MALIAGVGGACLNPGMNRQQVGRTVGAAVAVIATGALAVGGFALFGGAGQATESETVAASTSYTTETATTADYLQAARADKAARQAEAARVAAEQAAAVAAAEAARVAAEQAAAAEAEQVSAEQAADDPQDEPAPADDPWASKTRVPWIPSPDPQNAAGGDWDMSVCGGGSASTGPDGVPYCD